MSIWLAMVDAAVDLVVTGGGRRRRRKAKVSVSAINRTRRMALLTDGRVVPILRFLDDDDIETEVPDEAVYFVAGSEDDTLWVGLVDLFVRQTRH